MKRRWYDLGVVGGGGVKRDWAVSDRDPALVVDAEGYEVADCRLVDAEEEARANARFIASGPRLLAALYDIACLPVHAGGDLASLAVRAGDIARAAIKEAGEVAP